MKIILLGPPGAGKGTQAKGLAGRLSLTHISTGDLLRQNVAKGTGLGKEAKAYMDKGALVPDALVNQMLKRRFEEADIKKGFILDGYPRNFNQAAELDSILKSRDSAIDLVIYLETSEKVIIQRLTGRLVCKVCGANFHIANMPPKVKGVCDSCGGKLYQRTDDNEQTVRNRLEVYKNEVASLIDYYQTQGKLKRVDSDGESEAVLQNMIGQINS